VFTRTLRADDRGRSFAIGACPRERRISCKEADRTSSEPDHTKWVKLFENLKYVVIDAELATALTGRPVEWI
jgi:hypothetical protein